MEGVWRVPGPVNWYILSSDDGVVIIDAGLPGYRRHLDAVLGRLGWTLADVDVLILTHGHLDHVGMTRDVTREGARPFLHEADVPLANDPRRNRPQRSPTLYATPATAAFVAHCIKEGALQHRGMPMTHPLEAGRTLDIPGHPHVYHVPGHTSGSCAFDFPSHGVVFVGDALCTVSPITGRPVQPQVQTRGSNENSDTALGSLDALSDVTSSVVLPGHGPPWTRGLPEAISRARKIGAR